MDILTTDVLVIGGGAAGLRAAIAAREAGANVLLASKTAVGYANNTAVANGRIAAVVEPGDSPQQHMEDTIEAGRRLNDPLLVRILAEGSPRRIAELERFGVPLRHAGDSGAYAAGQSPGHSRPRILSLADGMGYTMSRAFRDYALEAGVRFAEGLLLTQMVGDGRAAGAVGLNRRGEAIGIQARSVVLAGGGAGQAYARTNNPAAMTGDGYALAYRSGLPLRDMEFVQFYPTVLAEPGQPVVTIYYERLLAQEGGRIRNGRGEDVLERHGLTDPQAATRDALARAMAVEIAEGRGQEGALVFDLSAVPARIVQLNLRALAPALRGRHSYLVAPAVHFFMGGVSIDEGCGTAIEGLYAAGEVTGGLHGANRLASNALAETLVFGALAGENSARYALGSAEAQWPDDQADEEAARLESLALADAATAEAHLREVIWDGAGPVRHGWGLERGLLALSEAGPALLTDAESRPEERWAAVEVENIRLVGEMVVRAAQERRESRGAHYRTDHPAEQAEWQRSIIVRSASDRMEVV